MTQIEKSENFTLDIYIINWWLMQANESLDVDDDAALV